MTRRSPWIVRAARRVGKELDIGPRFVLGALGLVAVVAIAIALFVWRERSYARNGPGELRAAARVTLASGRPAILVTAEVHLEHGDSAIAGSDTSRLALVDARDGQELARVVTDETRYCASASPGLLWCETNLVGGSAVELRDATTLAVQATHAEVIARAPPLAQQGHAAIEVATREAWLLTRDGRYWHVRAPGLTGEVADTPPDARVDVGPGRDPSSGSARTRVGGLYFDGQPRATMMVSDGRGAARALGAATWLHPQFLLDTDGPARAEPPPLWLDDHGLFVIHDDSVDHGRANVQLTAVDLDGTRRWTTAIGAYEIEAAWIIEGRLVLALHGQHDSAVIAFDGHNGQLAWRRGS